MASDLVERVLARVVSEEWERRVSGEGGTGEKVCVCVYSFVHTTLTVWAPNRERGRESHVNFTSSVWWAETGRLSLLCLALCVVVLYTVVGTKWRKRHMSWQYSNVTMPCVYTHCGGHQIGKGADHYAL